MSAWQRYQAARKIMDILLQIVILPESEDMIMKLSTYYIFAAALVLLTGSVWSEPAFALASQPHEGEDSAAEGVKPLFEALYPARFSTGMSGIQGLSITNARSHRTIWS